MGRKQKQSSSEEKFTKLWHIKNRPEGFSVPSPPTPRQLFMCIQCKKLILPSLMFLLCNKCEAYVGQKSKKVKPENLVNLG